MSNFDGKKSPKLVNINSLQNFTTISDKLFKNFSENLNDLQNLSEKYTKNEVQILTTLQVLTTLHVL